jgi:hypothetical protein
LLFSNQNETKHVANKAEQKVPLIWFLSQSVAEMSQISPGLNN